MLSSVRRGHRAIPVRASSATVAWLALASAAGVAAQIAPPVLDLLAMPETATLIQAWLPGWSGVIVAGIGIVARLRTLDLRG